MNIKTQLIIKGNPNIYQYLRENSYWYKYLNRNPNVMKELIIEMKQKYKLTTSDKLERINNGVSMINSFMDILKWLLIIVLLVISFFLYIGKALNSK